MPAHWSGLRGTAAGVPAIPKAERFRIGSAWVRKVTLENGKVVDNDMLFTKWNGEPMDPDIISSWFPKFLEAHNLPDVNFHSLRHSNASILIAAHVPITTVSGGLDMHRHRQR